MNDQPKDKPKAKPVLPTINETNRPFWEGCKERKLMAQRCTQCGKLRMPAAVCCPNCLSPDSKWEALSGRGKVFSYITFHRAYHPAWEGKVPYVVAMIELAEGPIMMSNVVGTEPAKVKVGDAVTVDYEPIDEAVTIPVFRPT